MSVSQAITYKRAVRQFKDIAIPKEVINSILKCGAAFTILKEYPTLGIYSNSG